MSGDSVRLSEHARKRCAQMNLLTGVVKRIVRHHDTAWRTACRDGDGYLVVAASNAFPNITVMYADQDPPIVVTVLWRTPEHYDRATYQPDGQVSEPKGVRR